MCICMFWVHAMGVWIQRTINIQARRMLHSSSPILRDAGVLATILDHDVAYVNMTNYIAMHGDVLSDHKSETAKRDGFGWEHKKHINICLVAIFAMVARGVCAMCECLLAWCSTIVFLFSSCRCIFKRTTQPNIHERTHTHTPLHTHQLGTLQKCSLTQIPFDCRLHFVFVVFLR